MSALYKAYEDPADGILLQYVGVYVARWQPEWGKPTMGFVVQDGASALIEGCRLLIKQYEESGDFVMGGELTNKPFLLIRQALEEMNGQVETSEQRIAQIEQEQL